MGDFSIRLAAWNLFTQENESRVLSQLSAGQVFGKIRVPAKSRNRCKLSLFRFHYSEKSTAQYISAEDGLNCPLQVRHLDLEPNYLNFLSSDEFPLEGQSRPP